MLFKNLLKTIPTIVKKMMIANFSLSKLCCGDASAENSCVSQMDLLHPKNTENFDSFMIATFPKTAMAKEASILISPSRPKPSVKKNAVKFGRTGNLSAYLDHNRSLSTTDGFSLLAHDKTNPSSRIPNDAKPRIYRSQCVFVVRLQTRNQPPTSHHTQPTSTPVNGSSNPAPKRSTRFLWNHPRSDDHKSLHADRSLQTTRAQSFPKRTPLAITDAKSSCLRFRFHRTRQLG